MIRDITVVSEGRTTRIPIGGSDLWTWDDEPAEGRRVRSL